MIYKKKKNLFEKQNYTDRETSCGAKQSERRSGGRDILLQKLYSTCGVRGQSDTTDESRSAGRYIHLVSHDTDKNRPTMVRIINSPI